MFDVPSDPLAIAVAGVLALAAMLAGLMQLKTRRTDRLRAEHKAELRAMVEAQEAATVEGITDRAEAAGTVLAASIEDPDRDARDQALADAANG